ncbi:hypothetical protein R7D97_17000 [Vibrio sp. Vb5031]|uniref:Uncharacterized protein n=2 Tax=Vibrio hepatarius TaxID=171383 RepID=A0A0M0HYY9_9VIBR|nr:MULTISPECIES: hypothetical protein [Vibrio]KOO06848.1 hypothetical protein AKJ31_14155 [Vibrio hepatarius]MCR9821699.1 hypothetical protein [Vibrio parahaemolyticus]MDW1505884.1 hypothetical protein [Vibrio sp. Vb5031]MDW1517099.1 hypothetical protein [Vibrio sp. Vb5035]MDW1547263.1 hypothetical protein [Vibrio sp. Vb5034]
MGHRINIQLNHLNDTQLSSVVVTANSSAKNFPLNSEFYQILQSLNGQPSEQLSYLLNLTYPKTEGNHTAGDRVFFLSTVHDDSDTNIHITLKDVIIKKSLPLYLVDVREALSAIDPDYSMSEAYFTESFNKGLSVIQAIESYIYQNPLGIKHLTPLMGSALNSDTVCLSRPYIPIDADEYEELCRGSYDFYQLPSGRVVTFSNASCHDSDTAYALCPMNNERTKQILSAQ